VKRERYSVEQIVAIMKQAEVGIPVAVLISQAGISEQAFLKRIVDERWIRRCCSVLEKKPSRRRPCVAYLQESYQVPTSTLIVSESGSSWWARMISASAERSILHSELR